MPTSRPITDSPWFWMLLYSTVPLIGLALLSRKYAERQSRLERQYQGRIDAAERSLKIVKSQENGDVTQSAESADASPQPAEYSTPADTIIPLTPLTLFFLAVACFAAVMLARERMRMGRGDQPNSSSNPP